MATLGDYIAARVRVALRQAFHDVQPELEKLAHETGGSGGSNPLVGIGSLFTVIENTVIAGLGVLDPEIAAGVAVAKAVEGEAGKLGIGVGAGYLLYGILFPAVQPFILPLYHAANALAENEIFDPNTAAQLAARGIITPGFAASEGGGGGLDQGHMNDLIEAAHNWPGLGELLELDRRNIASPADVAAALQRQGVHPEWIPRLQQLTKQLLSPADLALSVLRGFTTDADARAYASLLGVDDADFTTLINNTGEPPGTMQLLEAYRRGFIDEPRLKHGIVQSRVRPEWIDVIEKLRFQPMSVSDAVNAVVQNHLDHDTAKVYATQNGLDPDAFDVLVANHGRPLSRTEIGSLYHRGLATIDQFKQALRESDLKDKYIDQGVELARTLIPARQITTAIQHGALGRADGIAYLMMQGYTQTDAGILVDTGLAEHKATLKELTRSDVQALYTDKLITHQEAHAKLVLLGYDDATADELLALADAKHTAALARTLITQVKALYAKGELTRQQAVNRLIDGGVVNENARAQVDEWDILHSVPSRTLSEAQTVKAAEDGIIGIIEAAQRLVGMGYTRHDATVLLQTAGLVSYDSLIKPGWQPTRPGSLFSGADTQTGGPGPDTQTGGLVP